jgi:hypothetical protein
MRYPKNLSRSQPRASTNTPRKTSATPSDFVMFVSCKAPALLRSACNCPPFVQFPQGSKRDRSGLRHYPQGRRLVEDGQCCYGFAVRLLAFVTVYMARGKRIGTGGVTLQSTLGFPSVLKVKRD